MPIAIKSSGGGSTTIAAPVTASDYTLTAPAATGTILQSGTAVTTAQGGTGLTAAGTAGNALVSDGTNWISSTITLPNAVPSVIALYSLASGTAGSSGSASRATYPLNTLRTNTLGVSLSSNTITGFPAGTYYATWSCSAWGGTFVSWLRNNTAASDIAQGPSTGVTSQPAMVSNPGYASFTLSGTTTLSIEYITPSPTTGRLGNATSITGASEIYGTLVIWKVL